MWHYAFLGDYAQQVVAGAATDADTVRQYLAGFEAAGTDDVICFPASADVSQIDASPRPRLAEGAARAPGVTPRALRRRSPHDQPPRR